MTVAELRKALEGVRDDAQVVIFDEHSNHCTASCASVCDSDEHDLSDLFLIAVSPMSELMEDVYFMCN